MKRKDLKELRTKAIEDLENAVSKKRSDLLKLRVEVVSGKETNHKKIKNLRKEIAQILTLIKEKQIIINVEKQKKGE